MEKAADAAAAAAKTTDTSQKSLPPNSPDSIRSNSSSHHHSNLSSNNSSPTISQKHLPKPATVSPATSLKKLQFAALTTTIQPASPTSVVSAARNSIYNDGPISKSTSISSNVGTTLTSATPAPIIFRQQPLSSSGQCPLSSAGLRNELFNASKSNIYQNTESNGISSGGAGGSSSGRVSENSNPGGRDSKSIGQSAASNSSTTSGSNSGLNNSQAKNYWVNRLKRQNNHSIHQQTTQIINVYPNILKNTHSSGIIVVHSSSKSLAKSGSGSSVNNNGDSNLGSSNSLAKSGGGSYKQFVALKGSSSNILRPSNSRGNLLGGSLQTNISIPELSRPDGGETSVKKVGIAGLSMFLNTEYDSTGSSGSNCEVEVKLTSFGSGGEGAASRALKISSKKTTAPFRSESKNSLDIIKQITSRSALALPTSVISKSSVNHQSDFFNSSFNTDNMSTPAIIVVNTAASHISITNNIGDDDSDGGDDDIEIIADDDHHLDTYQTSKRKKGFSYVETALFDLLTRNECIGRGDLSPKSSAKNIMRISDPDLEDGARRQDDNQVQAGGGRYSISNQASTNSSQLSIESPKAAFPTALDSIDRPSLSFNNSGRRGSSVIRFQESRQEVKTSASTRRASIVSPHPMLTRRSSSISGYMSQTSGQMSQISRRASVSAAVAASFLSTPATPHQLPPITDDHKNNINLQSNSNNSSILQQQSPSSPHDYPPSTSNSIIQRSAQQSSSSHPHSGILHSHSVLFSTTNSNQPSVAPGAQIYMTHSLSANQLPNSPSGIPQSSNLGTFDGYIRPSLAAVTEPPKYTGGGTEKKALSNLDHKPSDGPQLNEPMQIVNQTLTMWEAFKRPFTESPSTGWTLQFSKNTESLYQLYLFHFLVWKQYRLVNWALVLSWLVFLILDIVKYSNTPFAGRLGMDIIILTATAFITYSSYSLKLYKSWNNVIHFSWAFLVALQGINLSTYDYVMNTENFSSSFIVSLLISFIYFTYPSSVWRLAAVGTFLTLFQISFDIYRYCSHITMNNAYMFPITLLISNILIYSIVNFIGMYFRYYGEIHMRRAFIKYKGQYRYAEKMVSTREQSEFLLKMILPEKIIETLRKYDGNPTERAKVSMHDTFIELSGVTILFADIVGFTEFASNLPAKKLIELLGEIFAAFDVLISDFDLEKIKTIGDCIQVAGGVPEQIQSEEDVKHTAEKVCILGLLMISTLQSICDKNRNTVETPMDLKLRVGINSGEVIAGVIGLWKFKYDLWSTDTDIASIMEQSGKHNIPHISPKTYDLVKQSQRLSFSKGDIIEAFGHRLPTHDVKFVDEESAQQIQKIIKQIKESQPTSRLRQSSSAKTTPSAINSKSNVAADVSLNSFNMSGLSMLKANVSDKAIYSPADVVKNMDDVAVNNNPIKGASYINPTKQKIREILSNFKTETHKMTGKFKEAEKENDYHNNLMGNYGLSQIITAIFICACCIVLMAAQEISVADILQVPSSLGLYQGRFWYQILAMLISILLIALTFRINVNYGKRMLMTEKTDLKQQSTFLVQSSYLTTSIQSLTSPSSASAIATASKQQQYKDPYSWFRPNLYAFLILWIGCGSVILTSYLIPASTNTLFYTVAVPIAEIHALFIGLDAIYLNSALLSMAIFMVATFSASSSNLLTGLDANSAISLAQYIVLISLLIFMTLINNFRFERISRLNFYLKRQNQVSFEQLKLTQHATESLLSNILPVTLVDKLKDSPSLQIAEDKPSLGIIFFSICNIDRLSEKSVIWLLNDIICDIDECCLLYGIEKIKTIGARYIACVEPCEDYDQDYLTRLISFSLELQNILNDFNERTEQSFTFRTGISVGPAAAGIIGTTKFTYDIWGDSVNMASRMESTGKEGKIQCTEALYLEMRDQFRFTPRGSVYVKGKGNMNTYFLEGLRLLPTAKKTATPTVSWRRRAESNE